jgi:hypothetical protein
MSLNPTRYCIWQLNYPLLDVRSSEDSQTIFVLMDFFQYTPIPSWQCMDKFSFTFFSDHVFSRFNARHSLSERMNQTVEFHMPRNLSSEEPKMPSFGWHRQVATSPTSATRYSPEVSSRYTPGASSHKQEGSAEGKSCVHTSSKFNILTCTER